MVLRRYSNTRKFNTVHDVHESLMNPLKERRTVTTTKAITTLFMSSVLLVGFIGMSLSLSQTAMAQQGPPQDPPTDTPRGPPADRPQGPQCSDDAIRFEQGRCIEPSEIDCGDLGEEFIVNPDNPEECIAPANPELVCPEGAGKLNEETELCEEDPVCPPGPNGATYTYIKERDRCERTPTASNPCNLGNQGTETRENIGQGQQRCVPKNKDVCDPSFQKLDTVSDQCTSEPDVECPEGARESEEFESGCEFFDASRETCPGGDEPIAGECKVRPGNRGAV